MTTPEPRPIPAPESESQNLRALLVMREMIMRGELRPGEHLREIPLAESLGVSRTPARLALERLAHEGLLEARPKGGFVVREFTLQDILDAIEVRGALEATAARMAVERLQCEEELSAMRQCLAEVRELIERDVPVLASIADYIQINDRFHCALIDLAKSTILSRSMEQVRALPFATPGAFTGSQVEEKSWRETMLVAQWQHEQIVSAIASRNSARASAAAYEHSRLALRGVDLALRHRKLADMPGGSLVRIPADAARPDTAQASSAAE